LCNPAGIVAEYFFNFFRERGGCVKNEQFQTIFPKVYFEVYDDAIVNKPARRSNPRPSEPEEEEEEARPGKVQPKRKKKTREYEVTC
jgi:hypothetical protein